MNRLHGYWAAGVIRIGLALLLCGCGIGLAFAATRVTAARKLTPVALAKIAPWVQEQTANGGLAEFLVVLNQQADLSPANALPTKEEKGRFVRDALWNTAQATQGETLAWLRSRGLEHRSYY